jgi:catalase-peroxidase
MHFLYLYLSLSLYLSGCELPLGTAAVGLVYVNPEGTPKGEFDNTATNMREVFARMGFDDRQTVAAIGGGHAFGK